MINFYIFHFAPHESYTVVDNNSPMVLSNVNERDLRQFFSILNLDESTDAIIRYTRSYSGLPTHVSEDQFSVDWVVMHPAAVE